MIVLSGLKAVSQQLGVNLPSESLHCFVEIEKEVKNKIPVGVDGDIPITWAIPQHADLTELLSDDGTGTEQSTVELGQLIARWNRMSLDG